MPMPSNGKFYAEFFEIDVLLLVLVPGTISIDKLYTHAIVKSTETSHVQMKRKTHKQTTNNKQHTHVMKKMKPVDKLAYLIHEQN